MYMEDTGASREVGAYLTVRYVPQALQCIKSLFLLSTLLMITRTPESGPKYSILRGMGLPATTD